jgi:hypothetical protein
VGDTRGPVAAWKVAFMIAVGAVIGLILFCGAFYWFARQFDPELLR